MIAAEDLILSKLVWAKQNRSELQLRDVQAMITVQQDLDWEYIDRWAVRLTVTSLLAATMKNTLNDAEIAFARRFASVAPIHRLHMVSEMFDSAKRLIAASVRETEPDISEVELRVRIFDRLYADDFDEAAKVKLRAALRRMTL